MSLSSAIVAFEGQMTAIQIQIRTLQDMFDTLKSHLPVSGPASAPKPVVAGGKPAVTVTASKPAVTVTASKPAVTVVASKPAAVPAPAVPAVPAVPAPKPVLTVPAAAAAAAAVTPAGQVRVVTKVKTVKSLAMENAFLVPVDNELVFTAPVTSTVTSTVASTVAPTVVPTVALPVASTVVPTVVPTVALPVASTVAPIEPPVAPTVAPIEPPVAPIEPPVAPIEVPVAPTVSPIEAPIAPIEAPIAPTVAPTVAPITTAAPIAKVVVPIAKVVKATLPVAATDALKDHKHRLQTLDPVFCRGRKVDEKSPIAGTSTEDPDANGHVYIERQCPKKVKKGDLLCSGCKEKDDEYKADPTVYQKRWWGRLDEPMYPRAMVVGCHHFYEKYPFGLPGDSSTAAPEAWLVANAQTVKKYKAKTKTVEKKKELPATPASSSSSSSTAAAAAPSSSSAAVAEVKASPSADEPWAPYLHECRLHVYEKATGKCYLTKTDKDYATYEEMKDASEYVGRYDPATDTLDPYGVEDEEEA